MNGPFVCGYATVFHTERYKERNVNEDALACYDIVFGAVVLLIQNSDMVLFSCFFFPLVQQPNVGQGRLILHVCRSHTMTHHSRYDSSGRGIGPSQRPLPDNTQH